MADPFSTKAKTKPTAAPQAADAPKFESPKFESPKFETPKFETPRFETPKFEMPNLEIPAAFREFAEKGVTQARDNWEKMKSATEEVTGVFEDSYNTTSKGVSDYGLKVIEVSRANADATFNFLAQVMAARSISEVIEFSTAHVRQQFDAVTAQTRDLSSLAQKVAADSVEPIKEGMSSAFKKVA